MVNKHASVDSIAIDAPGRQSSPTICGITIVFNPHGIEYSNTTIIKISLLIKGVNAKQSAILSFQGHILVLYHYKLKGIAVGYMLYSDPFKL